VQLQAERHPQHRRGLGAKRKAFEILAAQKHLWEYYTRVALNRGMQGGRNSGKAMTYGEAYQRLFPKRWRRWHDPVVIRTKKRARRPRSPSCSDLGVSTSHEAMGRSGLMKPYMRPIYAGRRSPAAP
jgi:hypothetical protein